MEKKSDAKNPLDVPQVRSPNARLEKGELGERLAELAIQAAYPGYRLAPSKADGVTGPDLVLMPDDPKKPIKVIEVKTIDGASRAGNPTRYLGDTKSGKQGSKEYLENWAKKAASGHKDPK